MNNSSEYEWHLEDSKTLDLVLNSNKKNTVHRVELAFKPPKGDVLYVILFLLFIFVFFSITFIILRPNSCIIMHKIFMYLDKKKMLYGFHF